MQRSRFLKYVSFLMMLTAFVRFFFGLGMFNVFVTAGTLGYQDGDLGVVPAAFGLIALCALCELISGFSGALNWEEPLRSRRCLIWGCVTLVLGIAGNAMQRITGYGVSIVAWCTGVVIPALYCAASLLFFCRSASIRRREI